MKNPLATVVCLILAPAACGCLGEGTEIGTLEVVWGRRGVSEGRLQKPRAVAIDAQDRIYIVDMTARIQVFNTDGRFLRGWRTPRCEKGKPTGLAIGRGGNVLVADTHYYRLLVYSPEGKLLQTIGGVAGQKPGQFIRPESLAIDQNDHIWVADACNHRIQVFDSKGNLIRFWGTQGAEPGKLYYPYDLVLGPDETVCVCEYGNHRVQKSTRDGRSLGCWGTHGRQQGQLHNTWGVVRDSQGRLYVLDSNNHRVQRVRM